MFIVILAESTVRIIENYHGFECRKISEV